MARLIWKPCPACFSENPSWIPTVCDPCLIAGLECYATMCGDCHTLEEGECYSPEFYADPSPEG